MKTKTFYTLEKVEVGIFYYSKSSELNPLIEKDLRLMGFSKNTDNNNVNAFLTTEFKSNFSQSLKQIEIYILECVEKYNQKITGGYVKNPSITSMWAALYQKNNFTESHKHMPNTYSFVYFVRSEKKHSPLKFDNSLFSFSGKPGDLIIFPSHIWHSVPKQKIMSQRITLIGNIKYDSVGF